MSITHAAVSGPLVELTDYQAAHAIANGTITVAQLSASGSASSSTFLRGDWSWSAPSSGSPLVSVGIVLGGQNTYYCPGPLISGHILILGSASVATNVTGITQTGVTWSKIDNVLLASGNYAGADLWLGVIGAGAQSKMTISTGGNTFHHCVAEFTGFTGTIVSHGSGSHAGGASLVLGPITSTAGQLVVASFCNRGMSYMPAGIYGGLTGLAVTSTEATNGIVQLGWWVSDGTSISPGTDNAGDNAAGAWGVLT